MVALPVDGKLYQISTNASDEDKMLINNNIRL